MIMSCTSGRFRVRRWTKLNAAHDEQVLSHDMLNKPEHRASELEKSLRLVISCLPYFLSPRCLAIDFSIPDRFTVTP